MNKRLTSRRQTRLPERRNRERLRAARSTFRMAGAGRTSPEGLSTSRPSSLLYFSGRKQTDECELRWSEFNICIEILILLSQKNNTADMDFSRRTRRKRTARRNRRSQAWPTLRKLSCHFETQVEMHSAFLRRNSLSA